MALDSAMREIEAQLEKVKEFKTKVPDLIKEVGGDTSSLKGLASKTIDHLKNTANSAINSFLSFGSD